VRALVGEAELQRGEDEGEDCSLVREKRQKIARGETTNPPETSRASESASPPPYAAFPGEALPVEDFPGGFVAEVLDPRPAMEVVERASVGEKRARGRESRADVRGGDGCFGASPPGEARRRRRARDGGRVMRRRKKCCERDDQRGGRCGCNTNAYKLYLPDARAKMVSRARVARRDLRTRCEKYFYDKSALPCTSMRRCTRASPHGAAGDVLRGGVLGPPAAEMVHRRVRVRQ
jgi:hypothetical protein